MRVRIRGTFSGNAREHISLGQPPIGSRVGVGGVVRDYTGNSSTVRERVTRARSIGGVEVYVERAMYDAWEQFRGASKEEAMQAYIDVTMLATAKPVVLLHIEQRLSLPISRADLLDHPLLKDMQLLRQPQGTTFKLTASEHAQFATLIERNLSQHTATYTMSERRTRGG